MNNTQLLIAISIRNRPEPLGLSKVPVNSKARNDATSPVIVDAKIDSAILISDSASFCLISIEVSGIFSPS